MLNENNERATDGRSPPRLEVELCSALMKDPRELDDSPRHRGTSPTGLRGHSSGYCLIANGFLAHGEWPPTLSAIGPGKLGRLAAF